MKIYFALGALLAAAALSLPAAAQTPAQSPAQTLPSPAARPVPSASAGAKPATASRTSLSQTAAAAGGGPGLVWVNTASKVYHCPGTAFYGKTKAGKYLAEDAAKAEGDRANAGRPCAK